MTSIIYISNTLVVFFFSLLKKRTQWGSNLYNKLTCHIKVSSVFASLLKCINNTKITKFIPLKQIFIYVFFM